jgi:hypothetical protein
MLPESNRIVYNCCCEKFTVLSKHTRNFPEQAGAYVWRQSF